MSGRALGLLVWNSSVLIPKPNLDKTQALPLPILLEEGGLVFDPVSILRANEPAKRGPMCKSSGYRSF